MTRAIAHHPRLLSSYAAARTVPPCMKRPVGCTRSPGMNKTLPGYQGHPSLTPVISTRPHPVPGYFAAGVPNLQKCWVQVWTSYRTYPSVRYGYGCRTKLTKGSGTGMDVVPSLQKGSGMVRLLVLVPVPDLGYFNRAVPGTRVFSSGSSKLTTLSGTGMDVVPNLPKCRVRVWNSYQAYQSVGYG